MQLKLRSVPNAPLLINRGRLARLALGSRVRLGRLFTLVVVAGLAMGFVSSLAAARQADDQPSTLEGIFAVTISRSDVSRSLAGGPSLIGQWIMTFEADGTYQVARQDVGVVASGAYKVSGATLTLVDWNGLLGCGGASDREATTDADAIATYAWRFEDDTLILTPIHESCTDRRLLLTIRAFVAYEPCKVTPLGNGSDGAESAAAEPAAPVGTPVSALDQDIAPDADALDGAIDELLRQATGCWATGDPARFLALHSERALADITTGFGPLPDFARDLRLFMATPIGFERIGEVHIIDPTRAWAYVEITLGGDPVPQRSNFALVDGVWLFDNFFLLGPPTDAVPGMTPDGPRYEAINHDRLQLPSAP